VTFLVVETVEKKREPMPAMEAIYLITPTVNSIRCLMSDFQVLMA
jgi:syntaxin-binding protein 1